MSTPKAFAALCLNAAFLPVAFWLDWCAAMQPTDNEQSGAPEGADVVRFDAYRESGRC